MGRDMLASSSYELKRTSSFLDELALATQSRKGRDFRRKGAFHQLLRSKSEHGLKNQHVLSQTRQRLPKRGWRKTLWIDDDDDSTRCFLCLRRSALPSIGHKHPDADDDDYEDEDDDDDDDDDGDDLLRCSWCQSAFYCCQEHFKQYHRVRSRCLPFRVVESRQCPSGKKVVASRDIREGELILEDTSAVAAPMMHSIPVCTVCLKRLQPETAHWCDKCGLPLCSRECLADAKHLRNECRLIRENKVRLAFDDGLKTPNPIYSTVIALRMLELRPSSKTARRRDLHLWNRVQELPDHGFARRGTSEWKTLHEDVVLFLRRRCFMSQWGEEELHRLLGVFLINSTPLEPKTKSGGLCPSRLGRVLFPVFSLLNHDCVANASYQIKEPQSTPEEDQNCYSVSVRASRDIKSGEEISVQYVATVLGTHKRRRKIKAEFYFECRCQRCADPTESSTFVSGLTCEACEAGWLLPERPLDPLSRWICSSQHCDFDLDAATVEAKVDAIEEELADLSYRKDLRRLEDFVTHYSKRILHPNHYLLLIAKRNYLFISRKQLIELMASCDKAEKRALTIGFKKKADLFKEFTWILKTLKCEIMF